MIFVLLVALFWVKSNETITKSCSPLTAGLRSMPLNDWRFNCSLPASALTLWRTGHENLLLWAAAIVRACVLGVFFFQKESQWSLLTTSILKIVSVYLRVLFPLIHCSGFLIMPAYGKGFMDKFCLTVHRLVTSIIITLNEDKYRIDSCYRCFLSSYY